MSERWKPKHGEIYYFISESLTTEVDYNEHTFTDKERIYCANCFRTEEEAEAAAEKVKDLLLHLHDNDENLQDTIQYMVTNTCQAMDKGKENVVKATCTFGNMPKLPDWCKFGVVGWHKRAGYFEVCADDELAQRISIRQIDDKSRGWLSYETLCTEVKQARRRPYNTKEMQELIGKVVVDNEHGNMFLVTAFVAVDEGEVCVDGVVYNADDLLECYTINGKPCGVLEHLNENREWVQ